MILDKDNYDSADEFSHVISMLNDRKDLTLFKDVFLRMLYLFHIKDNVYWGIMVRVRGSGYIIKGNRGGSRRKKEELSQYFYTFCKSKLRPWSSKLAIDQEGSANLLMIDVGDDNRLVSDAGTARIVEESLEEPTSLSREIDEYMDV
ncbi:hypothetical protein PVK06_048756 [Gossypium arboreum]|uniref:Uncharacterized protein n=1 Tax=Gossypium arboreum TaxID=29729 RepID=A0ABR0MGR3_GOSAR|nr:hypothetical protein PVK06_048756 [Gossypium arboreum]